MNVLKAKKHSANSKAHERSAPFTPAHRNTNAIGTKVRLAAVVSTCVQHSPATVKKFSNCSLSTGPFSVSQSRVKSDLDRSEEHTSELQSLMRISYAVFCLKKTKKKSI